jgi:rod shape-determining protein MreC
VPDERTYRRRRTVFLVLVLGACVLLFGTFLGALGGTERGFGAIFSPIQEGVSKAAKPGRDLVNWVGDTWRAKGELEDLRAERDALSIQNGRLQAQLEVGRQADQVREMRAALSLDKHGPVETTLVGASQGAWNRTIAISKGSSDGVTKGDPVIGAGGLVGTVIRAQSGSAVVRLITDPQSGVGARITSVNLPGALRPSRVGDENMTLVVGKSDRIRQNDLVVTAGTTSPRLPSLFPRGIPVGRVSKVTDPGVDAQQVNVRPVVDFRRLQVLTVLTEVQPEEAPQ